MRTIAEVNQWCAGAIEEFGDPSIPVCQLFVRYVEPDRVPRRITEASDLLCFREGSDLVLWLGSELIIPLNVSRSPEKNDVGELTAFGADSFTHGVWALTPSLNLPGVLHAFVVLYNVPVPAPWERLILLPHEVSA